MPDFRIRLNTEIDSGNAKAELEKLIGEFSKDPLKIKVDTGDASKGISQLTSDLKKLKEIAEKIKIGGTSSSGSSGFKKQTDSALSEFKKLTNEYNALQKQLSKETNAKSIQVLTKQLNEVYSAAEKVKSKLSGTDLDLAKQFESTSGRKLETNFLKTFNNIAQQAESLGGKINKAFNDQNFDVKGLEKVKSEFKEIQNTIENFDMSEMNSVSLNSLTTDLNKIQNEFKQLSNSAQQVKLENKFDIDCTKAINQLNKLKTEYESVGKDSSGIDNMISDINRLQNEIGSVDLGKLKGELDSINKQAGSMKTELSGAMKHVKSGFSDFTSSLSAFTIGNLAGDVLASALYGVKDTIVGVDSAFRDLAKVAPDSLQLTSSKMDEIRNKAADMGNTVGASMTDMINATASAMQLGIQNVDKAMEYGRNVNLFANVSDQSVGDADTQLKGILSAYGGINNALKTNSKLVKGAPKDYNGMMNVLDQLNYLGNNYAVTSGDMSESLSRFASVAKSSGVTIDQALSYAMGTNESIQNAEKTGNSLKTIITNLNGLRTSAKDGSIQTNKTAKALKEIAGVDVFDKQTGQVKDMNDILTEVADKYDSLSKNQKLALGEAIGGN